MPKPPSRRRQKREASARERAKARAKVRLRRLYDKHQRKERCTLPGREAPGRKSVEPPYEKYRGETHHCGPQPPGREAPGQTRTPPGREAPGRSNRTLPDKKRRRENMVAPTDHLEGRHQDRPEKLEPANTWTTGTRPKQASLANAALSEQQQMLAQH